MGSRGIVALLISTVALTATAEDAPPPDPDELITVEVRKDGEGTINVESLSHEEFYRMLFGIEEEHWEDAKRRLSAGRAPKDGGSSITLYYQDLRDHKVYTKEYPRGQRCKDITDIIPGIVAQLGELWWNGNALNAQQLLTNVRTSVSSPITFKPTLRMIPYHVVDDDLFQKDG